MNLQNWKGGRGLQPPLAPHREELSVDLSCILVLVIYLQLCFSFSYNTIYRWGHILVCYSLITK